MSAPKMAADFRRAAHIIRTGGLAKGTYVNGVGEHCTAGALRVTHRGSTVHYDRPRMQAELITLSELLGRTIVPCYCGKPDCCTDEDGHTPLNVVAVWNDAGSRTTEDVVTLLEQAAEKLEADQ